MTYDITNLIVPIWVSCRTYKYGQKDSRTYISNEKKHMYLQLDGLASDMWYMLVEKYSSEDFEKWAITNGVIEQVDEFIEQLIEQGLILSNQNEVVYTTEVLRNESVDEWNGDEDNSFISDMQSWLIENNFLFSLFFELTYKCNLKCVHCYNPKDMSSVEIEFEKCKQIIDEAYELGCFKMTFSGGEATLHSRFLEIIQYARSKRISVEIFSNGQVLHKNSVLYKSLLQLYPYRVCVSLYSMQKDTHEKVTAVKGSFERTYQLIQQLRKDNVNVQIKNFLLNINCRDCIKVLEMAKDIKASSVADLSLIPTIEGNKKTFEYMVGADELYALYSNPDSPLYVGTDYKTYKLDEIQNDSLCLGGFTGLCISPALDVNICVSMPMPVGNLKTESLTDIWQGAMSKDENNKLYQWQKVAIKDLKECYKEEYCKFCNYCPGMGFLENGYLKKSDVLCAQAKAKMKAYHQAKSNQCSSNELKRDIVPHTYTKNEI